MSKTVAYPIVVVGSGGVARSLVASLRNGGLPVEGIVTRTPEAPPRFPEWASLRRFPLNHVFSSDTLFFLTVPDEQIAPVARQIRCSPQSALVHCAGSVDLATLSAVHQPAAVFYPLQTLHPSKIIPFEGINVCIEATHAEIGEYLQLISSEIGATPHFMDSSQRLFLHASAVFACNFTNLMYVMAEEICKNNSIDFSMLHPLILRTAQKAIEQSPAQTQTGPAVRNDLKVIEKHLSILPEDLKPIYELLTNIIRQKSLKRW